MLSLLARTRLPRALTLPMSTRSISSLSPSTTATSASSSDDWTQSITPPQSKSSSGLDLSGVGLVQKMLFSHCPPTPTEAEAEATTTGPKLETTPSLLHRMDIRVGRVIDIQRHASADHLYVQEVQTGEDSTRTIVSGLAEYLSPSELADSSVILVRNMKPSRFRGTLSQGMLLCAESDGRVLPLRPPTDARPGDRVYADDHTAGSPDEVLRPKLRIVEQVCEDLRTDAQGIARYRGDALRTASGPIHADLPDAQIH